MQFFPTLLWYQWLPVLLVPPLIVLLYFLKLRRHPLEVPSTYLWTRTIEDLHVNTIWQRLRRSLLLFLQLLLVALLILALFGPAIPGGRLLGERFIFMIDTSASMRATDVPGSRLELAKKQILELIDSMEDGDSAMIITFSDTARIEQTYTDRKSLLRRAVRRIRPTNRSSDLEEALRAAAGLANPAFSRLEGAEQGQDALPATVYIASDGAFPSLPDFALRNLTPIHLKIGRAQGTRNVAITQFSAERNPENPTQLQAFARIENHSDEEITVNLRLFLDGALADASDVEIAARDFRGAAFDLPVVEEGVLRLEANVDDQLSLDNQVEVAINRTRPSRVLVVTPDYRPLQLALRTEQARQLADVAFAEPDVLTDETHLSQAASGQYDVIIYHACAPAEMPQANTVFWGQLPPDPRWQAGELTGPGLIIDVNQLHPVLQLIDMSNVHVLDIYPLTVPSGGDVLIDSVVGPMMAIAPREGFQDVVIGFNFMEPNAEGELRRNTDWPRRNSFPVFILNLLAYLGGHRGEIATAEVRPGETAFIRPVLPVDQIRIRLPDGTVEELRREATHPFAFTGSSQLGIYEVFEGDREEASQRFSVNLFDSAESDLRPLSFEVGHEQVAVQSSITPARRQLWKWVLIAALCLLLFEWYVYNRRVYI